MVDPTAFPGGPPSPDRPRRDAIQRAGAPAGAEHGRLPAHASSPSAIPPALPVLPASIAGVGLVVMIVGTFLPWVSSGQVRRSSYAASGVIDRLGVAGEGMLDALVRAWPLFGALCVLPVVAALLRWWRTAGVLAALLALVGGAVSVGALVFAARRGPSGTVSLDPLGPTATIAGAALLLVGGLLLTFRGSRRMISGSVQPLR